MTFKKCTTVSVGLLRWIICTTYDEENNNLTVLQNLAKTASFYRFSSVFPRVPVGNRYSLNLFPFYFVKAEQHRLAQEKKVASLASQLDALQETTVIFYSLLPYLPYIIYGFL